MEADENATKHDAKAYCELRSNESVLWCSWEHSLPSCEFQPLLEEIVSNRAPPGTQLHQNHNPVKILPYVSYHAFSSSNSLSNV